MRATGFLIAAARLVAQPAGLIVYAGAQWLLFAFFLARGGLTAGGDFALAQAFAAPLFALFSFSLRQLWVSRPNAAGNYARLVVLRLGTTALAAALAVALAAATGAKIALAPFAFVLFIKAQEAVADIFYAGLDANGRSQVAGLMLGLKGGSIAAAVGAALLWDLSAGVLGVLVVVSCGSLLILEGGLARFKADRQSFAVWREWAGPDAPLRGVGWISLANVLIAVTGFLPRYVLELFATRADVGLLAAVMMPVTLLLLVATGLSQSSLLELARAVRDRNAVTFKRVLGYRTALLTSLPVLLSAILIGAAATPLTPMFRLDPAVLRLSAGVTILMIPAVVAQIVSYAYLPLRAYPMLAAINAAALFIAAVAAWPLVRFHPIYGGAMLACLPSLVQLVAFGTGLRRHFARQEASV
jgi:O-antigen/teichoic acid export membrane protein